MLAFVLFRMAHGCIWRKYFTSNTYVELKPESTMTVVFEWTLPFTWRRGCDTVQCNFQHIAFITCTCRPVYISYFAMLFSWYIIWLHFVHLLTLYKVIPYHVQDVLQTPSFGELASFSQTLLFGGSFIYHFWPLLSPPARQFLNRPSL